MTAARGAAAAAALLLLSGAAPDPLARLDALLRDMDTLSADVLQLIVESDGGVLEESEIRMRLRRPDGFRWETLTPFEELIVADGSTLWHWQPDLEQVVIEDWDSGRSEPAVRLLNGRTDGLAEDYAVAAGPDGPGGRQAFTLTPRAPDSPHRLITVGFAEGEIELIRLDGRNGQRTVWRFSDVRRGEPLPGTLFRFEPPAGVEIVDDR